MKLNSANRIEPNQIDSNYPKIFVCILKSVDIVQQRDAIGIEIRRPIRPKHFEIENGVCCAGASAHFVSHIHIRRPLWYFWARWELATTATDEKRIENGESKNYQIWNS